MRPQKEVFQGQQPTSARLSYLFLDAGLEILYKIAPISSFYMRTAFLHPPASNLLHFLAFYSFPSVKNLLSLLQQAAVQTTATVHYIAVTKMHSRLTLYFRPLA